MNQLTLDALQWGYPTRAPLSLTVKTGERLVILGQNGSGKTMLLHTLMGLIPAKAGRVLLNHQLLSRLTGKTRAQHLGLLLQETHTPFPLSVNEYCQHAYYARTTSTAHERHLNTQSALTAVDLLSHQHQSLTTLSGGERKRAALAALFIQNPHFYLLDEPDNHLDLKHQHQLLQTLIQQPDKGLIINTHDLLFAHTLATHVLLLFNDGTHLTGKAQDYLTEPLLSRLYETPLPHIKLCFKTGTCHTQTTILGENAHDN